MTALQWDQAGERRYQLGVDHGVLYLPDGSGVAWNGLTQVTESLEREVKSYYTDGIKYLDHQVLGAYSAKLEAYTYPDELDDILGIQAYVPGVFLHDQPTKTFSISYRTLIGNDLEGQDHGYKIHVIYNLTANPSSVGLSTISDSAAPGTFSWDLTAVPPAMQGARPTAHISLDSRLVDSSILTTVEQTLYGTAIDDPTLPELLDLLSMIEAMAA